MGNPTEFRALYRYTSFASSIDILRTGEIALLNPASWSDRNDTRYLDAYLEKHGLVCARALCFTKAAETSHHWAAYGAGGDGVRLLFDWDCLEADIEKHEGVVLREVDYRMITEVDEIAETSDDWPFIKRYPYRGEEEVRALFTSAVESPTIKRIRIGPKTLREVALSPNLHEGLKDGMKALVNHAAGEREIRVIRSTLLANERWIKPIETVAKRL